MIKLQQRGGYGSQSRRIDQEHVLILTIPVFELNQNVFEWARLDEDMSFGFSLA